MHENHTTEQQVELLTIQLIGAMGFLLTVVISIILTYDKILSLSDQPRLFSDEYARKLSHFNSILIIIVVLIYLYVGYGNIQVAKQEGKKTTNLYLQEFNSGLAFLAAIIGYYIVTHESSSGLPIANTALL